MVSRPLFVRTGRIQRKKSWYVSHCVVGAWLILQDNAKTLVFPEEKELGRREKVSYHAMELINSLLQEKEHRLSSKKYRLNDYHHSFRTPGQLVGRRADIFAQDYQGNYVYPDDAIDIKSHQFFRRISWDRLHLTRPPFVPDVKGGDDTKYFDEDEPVSDVDDTASQSYTSDIPNQRGGKVVDGAAEVTQVDGPYGQGERSQDLNAERDGQSGDRAGAAGVKDKKRPRDKVLRDGEVGRAVLDLRKKGAFLGYTYRRPNVFPYEERVPHAW